MPQIKVYLGEPGAALPETGEARGRDLCTPVEVNTAQLTQPRPDVAEAEVSHPPTLADVEDVEVGESLADPRNTLIADLAADQGQTPEVEEAAGDVVHGGVGDSVTEREVESLEADTALC